MNRILSSTAMLLLTTATAIAGGVERAPQSLNALFEPGNYAEFSIGFVNPSVSGSDVAGVDTGDVAKSYNFGNLAYKHQFNDKFSGAFIIETPFGSDVAYPSSQSPVLGGTKVEINSTTYTAIGRYKINDTWGVHAGLRASQADGNVSLVGAAYGLGTAASISGYSADLDSDTGFGYLIGASWERPDIAARVSLTYQSEIEHDFDTVETINPDGAGPIPVIALGDSTTKITTPRSWNLEGQTGVAKDTLVFGSIRWVNWSEFKVRPDVFVNRFGVTQGLVTLEDTTTYTLGVGRKFTDQWSGIAAVAYEPRSDEPMSPLLPYNGRKSISLGAVYTNGPMKVTGLVTYAKLGSTDIGTTNAAGTRVFGETDDNHLWAAGVKIGYSF